MNGGKSEVWCRRLAVGVSVAILGAGPGFADEPVAVIRPPLPPPVVRVPDSRAETGIR